MGPVKCFYYFLFFIMIYFNNYKYFAFDLSIEEQWGFFHSLLMMYRMNPRDDKKQTVKWP